ncbi:MAG TPA: hypothetical protein VNG69_06520 [Casimicrobiaceae bacterium]|nr:hypothetical protein [Casimicrobiaceae bacterium]
MERCSGCQFFDRNQRNSDTKAPNAGQCRRNAPSLSPINQKSYMIEGVWPTVRDEDWCGEWKALVRRVDPSRMVDPLGASLGAIPPTAMPPGTSGMPPPRVSVQAARATLASLGGDGRSATVTPLPGLSAGISQSD